MGVNVATQGCQNPYDGVDIWGWGMTGFDDFIRGSPDGSIYRLDLGFFILAREVN